MLFHGNVLARLINSYRTKVGNINSADFHPSSPFNLFPSLIESVSTVIKFIETECQIEELQVKINVVHDMYRKCKLNK